MESRAESVGCPVRRVGGQFMTDLAATLAERAAALYERESKLADRETALVAGERLLEERQADYRETRHAMRRARASA